MDVVSRRGGVPLAAVTAVGAIVALVVFLVGEERSERLLLTPPPAAVQAGVTVERAVPACATAEPFVPSQIAVQGVVRRAEVMALPRDANRVPGVPPIGRKHTFAWDRPGIRPGEPRGNVLMNVHTWPDGSATGNALLRELRMGDRIDVFGEGRRLCYEVTERIEVAVEDGYPPYYDTEGPAQLAIVVCSGDRRGPGDWSHRTIWFARPVTQPQASS